MVSVIKSGIFDHWLSSLRDRVAQARIVSRLLRLEDGNFGDAKFFEGIGELRIDTGPGYRVYFLKHGETIVVLLCGGDKATQSRDIKAAKELARVWKEKLN
ncbi:MAG: type II toxin-antitoxin system RelE/ParE family toxin [Rhizobiaceae bacterium]